jgi:hypothetical protein
MSERSVSFQIYAERRRSTVLSVLFGLNAAASTPAEYNPVYARQIQSGQETADHRRFSSYDEQFGCADVKASYTGSKSQDSRCAINGSGCYKSGLACLIVHIEIQAAADDPVIVKEHRQLRRHRLTFVVSRTSFAALRQTD